MCFNPFLIPTLLLSYVLFFVGYWLSKKCKSNSQHAVLASSSILLSIPGLLIALYYLHLYDNWAWFYNFRSWTGTELTEAGLGLPAGVLAFWSGKTRFLRLISKAGILTFLSFAVFLPHCKPVIAKAEFGEFKDKWDGDICMQSTGYSCGAASAATLLRHFGIRMTELEVAKKSFTYYSGTEIWYIARVFRHYGLSTEFIIQSPEQDLPFPSIAGSKIGGIGHFIAILGKSPEGYATADPLIGLRSYTENEMRKKINLTGFYLKVSERSD